MSDAIAATNLLKSTNRTVDLCVFVCVCTSRIILFSLVGNISIFSVTNPRHCGLPPFLPHPRGINTVLVPVLPVTEGFTLPRDLLLLSNLHATRLYHRRSILPF